MFVLFSCFKCTCELALTLSLLLSFSFLVLFLKYIARLLFCLFFFKLFLLGEFADDADESAILVTHFANVRAKQLHHLLGFLFSADVRRGRRRRSCRIGGGRIIRGGVGGGRSGRQSCVGRQFGNDTR